MKKEKITKERQSNVSKAGKDKEKEVIQLLLSDNEIREHFSIGHPSKVLKNIEELYIQYGDKSEMIDADVCVVRKKDNKLVCVISVKKSFRERGAQTAYWALKVKQYKKNYKYLLATPDVDKELFNPQNPENKRKWRVILPFESDGVFVYSYDGKLYEEHKFYVGKDYLLEYIKSLVSS